MLASVGTELSRDVNRDVWVGELIGELSGEFGWERWNALEWRRLHFARRS